MELKTAIATALVVTALIGTAGMAAALEEKQTENISISTSDVPGTLSISVDAPDGVNSTVNVYEPSDDTTPLHQSWSTTGSANLSFNYYETHDFEVELLSDANHSASMTVSIVPDDSTATATATATETPTSDSTTTATATATATATNTTAYPVFAAFEDDGILALSGSTLTTWVILGVAGLFVLKLI